MSMPEKDTPIIIPNTSSILVMCLNFFRTIHGETNKHVHERTIFSTFLKHFLDFSTGFHTISRKHKISGSPRYVVATLAQTSLLKNISTPEPLWRSVLVKRKVPHKMWLPQKGSQYGNGPRFFVGPPETNKFGSSKYGVHSRIFGKRWCIHPITQLAKCGLLRTLAHRVDQIRCQD